jgi:hypothetical protein
MRYVVETRMGSVWEAVWSEDQEPMTFEGGTLDGLPAL